MIQFAPSKITSWLLAGYLLIALLTAYAYRNHYSNPFVFDDSHAIVDNVHIRSLSNIPKFFVDPTLSSTLPNNQGYRPIVTSSLALDYWLGGGLRSYYFHRSMFAVYLLQNLILCHLLFVFLLRISPGEPRLALAGSLLSTALYALHPANAETINYIIARSDSYSTFFVVLALWFALVPRKMWIRLLSLPVVCLGILSKEPASTFPALLFFAVLFSGSPFTTQNLFTRENFGCIRSAILKVLPAAIAVVGAVVLYFSMVINALPASTTRAQYLATQAWVVTHYLLTFLYPIHLNADSDLSAFDSIFDERALAGAVILGLLLLAALVCARTKRLQPISFGILWFFITLSPTSSIFPIEDVTNDHRMFFPFIGLSLAAGWALTVWVSHYLSSSSFVRINKVLFAGLAVVYFASDVRAIEQRCTVWRSNETLWYDVTLKSPLNARGLMNYGLSQMAKADYPRAEEYYLRAEKLWPNYGVLQTNFGILYGAMGRKQEAEVAFHKAINMSARSPTPFFYYARWLHDERRFAESKMQLERSLAVNPTYLDAIHLLIADSLELEDKASLSSSVEKLAALFPADPELVRYRKILSGKLPLKSTGALLEESLAAYQRGDFELCLKKASEVLQQSPSDPSALNNAGAALIRLGNPEEAVPMLARSVRLQPDFELAKNNLAEAQALVAAKASPEKK